MTRETEFLNVFEILDEFNICLNEFALAGIIHLAQKKGMEQDIIEQYFYSRMCVRGNTCQQLQGLKDAGVIKPTFIVPNRGQAFDVRTVPLNEKFVWTLEKNQYFC